MPGLKVTVAAGDPETKSLGKARAAGASDAHGPGGINYIIAIGIDTYNSGVVKDFAYRNCEKDCRDLVAILTIRYLNFQIYKEKPEAPDLLLNADATLTNILDRIEAFANDKTVNTINNNLILFFSGHGGEVAQGYGKMGCWIPYGCKVAEYDEVVPYDKMTPFIKKLKTQNFLFISDSCRSGRSFGKKYAL